MRLLLDGDTLTYVVGYATNDVTDFKLIKTILTKKIQYICNTWGSYEYSIYLTSTKPEDNYRFELATIKPYKGNRKGEKPKWYKEIRQYLMDTHGAIIVTNGEADDELGRQQSEGTMIVTIDKDLMQIPGRIYDFKQDRVYSSYDPGQLTLHKKVGKDGVKYTLKGVGFKWFCAQCFLGDTVDNIPGLKGYGAKKTYTYLKDLNTTDLLWAMTVAAFKEAKKLDHLREVAQLLWIQRSNNDLLTLCLGTLDERR